MTHKKLLHKIAKYCANNDIMMKVTLLAGLPYSHNLNDLEWEVRSMRQELFEKTFEIHPLRHKLRQFEDEEDFQDWLWDNELYGFFIELNYRIVEYSFDQDGNEKSGRRTCSYHLDYLYVESLEDLFKVIQRRSQEWRQYDLNESRKKHIRKLNEAEQTYSSSTFRSGNQETDNETAGG